MWMRSSRVWIRSSRVWMRSSRVWMRSQSSVDEIYIQPIVDQIYRSVDDIQSSAVSSTVINSCSSLGLSGAVSSSHQKQLPVSGHFKVLVSSIFPSNNFKQSEQSYIRSSRECMRSSRLWMRSSRVWMRSQSSVDEIYSTYSRVWNRSIGKWMISSRASEVYVEYRD